MVRGFIPVRLRSSREISQRGVSGKPCIQVLRLLRSRTGINPLTTGITSPQETIHHRNPTTTGIHSPQECPHHRNPLSTGTPSPQESIHHRNSLTTGIHSPQELPHHRNPFTTGIPSPQESIHHRNPLSTGTPSPQASPAATGGACSVTSMFRPRWRRISRSRNSPGQCLDRG